MGRERGGMGRERLQDLCACVAIVLLLCCYCVANVLLMYWKRTDDLCC